MRTYITTRPAQTSDGVKADIVFVCQCGTVTPVVHYVDSAVRPKYIDQLNTQRLLEHMGVFNMEHSDCERAKDGT